MRGRIAAAQMAGRLLSRADRDRFGGVSPHTTCISDAYL